MNSIPRIQIRQQMGRIGIESTLGELRLEQPKATMDFQTTLPKVEIRQQQGQLEIDSSKAWDALGRGGILRIMMRIFGEAERLGQEAIARIAQRGDRMAAIHTGEDAIAELARESRNQGPRMHLSGPASVDNVDIFYTARKPQFQYVEGRLDGSIRKNDPTIQYERGKVHIYMMQYPKVEIIPPQIDVRV